MRCSKVSDNTNVDEHGDIMKLSRAHTWIYTTAATVLVAQVGLCVPLYVNAASTNASVGVNVLTQPSTIGTLSIFEASFVTPQANTKANNGLAKGKTKKAAAQKPLVSQSISANGIEQTVSPAVFSIAGLPSQTFAIVMPQPGVSSTPSGNVEFLSFAHNAGNTPTIGTQGSTVFSVGAQMQFTSAANRSASSGVFVSQPQTAQAAQKQATPKSAKKLGMARPNPFGVQGVQDGFMNVLVSYN